MLLIKYFDLIHFFSRQTLRPLLSLQHSASGRKQSGLRLTSSQPIYTRYLRLPPPSCTHMFTVPHQFLGPDSAGSCAAGRKELRRGGVLRWNAEQFCVGGDSRTLPPQCYVPIARGRLLSWLPSRLLCHMVQ
jgi:hypothetical protein